MSWVPKLVGDVQPSFQALRVEEQEAVIDVIELMCEQADQRVFEERVDGWYKFIRVKVQGEVSVLSVRVLPDETSQTLFVVGIRRDSSTS
ncbi:MAG: hypothetical protein AAF656_05375 [Planctomycetota bacterium]